MLTSRARPAYDAATLAFSPWGGGEEMAAIAEAPGSTYPQMPLSRRHARAARRKATHARWRFSLPSTVKKKKEDGVGGKLVKRCSLC